jgi:subtilisin family serine protease
VRVYQFRHIRAEAQCSRGISLPSGRTIFGLRRGLLICGLLGLALAPAAHAEPVEVVVTMKQPPLAEIFAGDRSLAFSSFARPRRLLLRAAASQAYLRRLDTAQRTLEARIRASVPRARVRWRYGVVLNGFAVVVPRGQVGRLARLAGVEKVWPTIRYHSLLDVTPQLIGATALWGPTLATAGQGMKIAIVDDGIDQTHLFFSPRGFAYPPGFPKGQTAFTTPKVIVARAFPPSSPRSANAARPFDPENSEHAMHVAGIAAGNEGTLTRNGFRLSGIAPRAYLGNYKALTVPSQFGLNGNSPELAAAIEAAVRDGMDVINFSIGEVEIEPSRDLVVRALNAAADAGVVSAVAAGNDLSEFGIGSVGSPASAAKVIAAGASSGGHGSAETDTAADFSSAGPTSYSLRFKPDVTAPGEDVASAAPGGSFVELSGTSMAAPHVAGAAALLRQRHPDWTPAQVKSSLVTTGVPVRSGSGEVSPLRQGGGRIDLVRADRPLVFASPTSLSLGLVRPGTARMARIRLTDAGGGAGTWSARVSVAGLSVPAQVDVPGTLAVRATVSAKAAERDVSGFVVLSRGTDSRRIPFWFRIVRQRLRLHPRRPLAGTGTYRANTARGPARVSSYRYPAVLRDAAFPVRLLGREIVYRVRVRRPANFGVAVVARAPGVRVEPRIVHAGDENHLAGYTALPLDLNPYRSSYGRHRLVAAVVLPGPGAYDIVFDTPSNARPGAFRFRFWVNDTTPPAVRVLGVRGGFLELAVTDRGAGVDPRSLTARIDGDSTPVSYSNGRARVPLTLVSRGRHQLNFSVADYQETKNMENVPRIRPNTRTIQATFSR